MWVQFVLDGDKWESLSLLQVKNPFLNGREVAMTGYKVRQFYRLSKGREKHAALVGFDWENERNKVQKLNRAFYFFFQPLKPIKTGSFGCVV